MRIYHALFPGQNRQRYLKDQPKDKGDFRWIPAIRVFRLDLETTTTIYRISRLLKNNRSFLCPRKYIFSQRTLNVYCTGALNYVIYNEKLREHSSTLRAFRQKIIKNIRVWKLFQRLLSIPTRRLRF